MMFRIRSVWTLAVLACTILSTNSFASRRGDLPSSQNGPGPITDCPDPSATPYLAALDGHTTACSTSGGPYTYPNLVATFAGNGYTVVITPVLWMNGGFSGSAKTILQVQVQRPAGSTTTVTLNSLALQSLLTNPNYLACDMPSASNDDTTSGTANGNVFGYCMKYRMMTIPPLATTASTYSGFDLSIQEPDPIEFADNTTTRWDFIGFTQDQTFELVADGFPNAPRSLPSSATSVTTPGPTTTPSIFPQPRSRSPRPSTARHPPRSAHSSFPSLLRPPMIFPPPPLRSPRVPTPT